MFRDSPCQRSGYGFLQAVVRKMGGLEGLGLFWLGWFVYSFKNLTSQLRSQPLFVCRWSQPAEASVQHSYTLLGGSLSVN